ncbi:MAG: PepSY domain-containing protein [Spongiibacteraceae bacterium]|jgi:uncharacterized membrane protein YkoI|nr:PepSY domain-containing protein [Spongiibacteraceae bacterium]
MQTLTRITAALALAAAMTAHADVPFDRIQQLVDAGTVQPMESLREIALQLHPNAEVIDEELDHEHGRYVYQVELRDSDNREWDIDLDASTGAVLEHEED